MEGYKSLSSTFYIYLPLVLAFDASQCLIVWQPIGYKQALVVFIENFLSARYGLKHKLITGSEAYILSLEQTLQKLLARTSVLLLAV